MIDLKVRKAEMCSAAEGMYAVASDMQDLSEQVEKIRGELQFCSGMVSIRGRLRDLSRAMERQGVFSKKLGEKQVACAEMYGTAELLIAGQWNAEKGTAQPGTMTREQFEQCISEIAMEFGQDNTTPNESWFDEMIAKLRELFDELSDVDWEKILNGLLDAGVVGIFELLAVLNVGLTYDSKTNRSQNDILWNNYLKNQTANSPKYLENQKVFSSFSYGGGNMGANGCGVIAVYNALWSLSSGTSAVPLPELIQTFEKNGAALEGVCGTAPREIDDYFRRQGYESHMIPCNGDGKMISRLEGNYETFIMLAQNTKGKPSDSWHYVSITKESNGYRIHNNGDNNTYATLEDAVNGFNNGTGEPVSLIGVRNK